MGQGVLGASAWLCGRVCASCYSRFAYWQGAPFAEIEDAPFLDSVALLGGAMVVPANHHFFDVLAGGEGIFWRQGWLL